jgi:hypothetical protein
LLLGAGTHGSLKRYEYATTKDNLSTVITSIIKSNATISGDTDSYFIDTAMGKNDTIIDNSYNNGVNYLTFLRSAKHDLPHLIEPE